MTTAKKATKSATKKAEDKQAITSLRLVARGRANIDFKTEMSVESICANVINVENDKRFFDESLAHVCARITKYVDMLELIDNESNLVVARVSCNNVSREEYKKTAKSTAIFLDKINENRVFKIEYLNAESNELETSEESTTVRTWKYRRDERRNEFISHLKNAINKVDKTLVSIKQVTTMSQDEIDATAELAAIKLAAKVAREKLASAKKARQEAS